MQPSKTTLDTFVSCCSATAADFGHILWPPDSYTPPPPPYTIPSYLSSGHCEFSLRKFCTKINNLHTTSQRSWQWSSATNLWSYQQQKHTDTPYIHPNTLAQRYGLHTDMHSYNWFVSLLTMHTYAWAEGDHKRLTCISRSKKLELSS